MFCKLWTHIVVKSTDMHSVYIFTEYTNLKLKKTTIHDKVNRIIIDI